MNNNMVEIKHTYESRGEYDVIVAGGGVSGIAAAVSASRRGRSVLLVEKANVLGGLATIGLVNYWVPMCNGRGHQIVKGIAEEMLRMSIKLGWDTLPDEWKDGEPSEETKVRYVTFYSPEIYALQLTKWLKDEGVHFFFDCIASEPVMDGGVCRGLILESKSGREYYRAKTVIDATGDCDILRRSGMPTVRGKNYFTYYAKLITMNTIEKALEKRDMRYLDKNCFGGSIDLYGHNQPADVPLYHGLTVEDVTDYLTTQQLLLLKNISDQPRRERDISLLPHMPQLRTTCHIDGDYCFTVENDKFRHFDDSVSAICDFDRRDYLYEVPYRTLIKHGFDNLMTCGRSVCADGYGWDVLRVIPVACLTGQAAGEACALAVENGTSVCDIDITELQKRLADGGVMIHFPDELVPEDGDRFGEKASGDHF